MNTSNEQINLLLDELLNLHPKKIDLSLDRTFKLLEKLGNPQKKITNSVMCSGTNGKFSTLNFIKEILRYNNKTINAYISPHLVKFNERFEILDKIVTNDELYKLLSEVKEVNQNESITFFEITTSAFFKIAAENSDADYTLCEIGLGGEFDSVNVFTPTISVISSISKDHKEFLGSDIKEIAAAKAGIIKKHVPVVIGYQPFEEAKKVLIDYAHSIEAPTWIYDQDFFIIEEDNKIIYEDNDHKIKFDSFNNYSKFQVKNLGLAIATCLQLYNIDVKEFLKINLHQHVYFPGRFEKIKEGRLFSLINKNNELYLDGSHNSDAAQNINQSLMSMPPKDLCIIIGMLNTKDPEDYIKQFSNIKEIKTIKIPSEESALSAKELKDRILTLHDSISEEDSIEAAIKAMASDNPKARILICGSLYLAGKVLELNSK